MGHQVQVFTTCLGDQFFDQTLRNMVHLLERLGLEPIVPEGQTCCGQPLFNNGFEEKTRPVARHFLSVFGRNKAPVVAPSASCVSMIRHHYPNLFLAGSSEHELAEDLAQRTFEFTEFLVHVLHITDVGAVYPHKVTYHASCHGLREMGLRDEAKILLSSVRGIELVPLIEETVCCGFGGAFSVTYPMVSQAMMKNKVRHIIETGADTVVVGEPGCLMNIAGGLHRAGAKMQARHIIDVLAANEEMQ